VLIYREHAHSCRRSICRRRSSPSAVPPPPGSRCSAGASIPAGVYSTTTPDGIALFPDAEVAHGCEVLDADVLDRVSRALPSPPLRDGLGVGVAPEAPAREGRGWPSADCTAGAATAAATATCPAVVSARVVVGI
ncbi:unnamed protein product, partial [Ectocarpus sp. 8 AP-2014]